MCLYILQPGDSTITALRLMSELKLTTVHIVSEEGEPVGTITMQDLCKYIIVEEAKSKLEQQHQQQQQAASAQKKRISLVVRSPS
jgi:hypothetical protein